MEEEDTSLFTTSSLFTTMLRRTRSRFVPAAGGVFVFPLLAHFVSSGPTGRDSRVPSLPGVRFSWLPLQKVRDSCSSPRPRCPEPTCRSSRG